MSSVLCSWVLTTFWNQKGIQTVSTVVPWMSEKNSYRWFEAFHFNIACDPSIATHFLSSSSFDPSTFVGRCKGLSARTTGWFQWHGVYGRLVLVQTRSPCPQTTTSSMHRCQTVQKLSRKGRTIQNEFKIADIMLRVLLVYWSSRSIIVLCYKMT